MMENASALPPSPSRRRFLLGAGGAAVAAAGGLAAWDHLVRDRVAEGPRSPGAALGLGSAVPPGRPDTIVVVVQLGGGNDALNTLIPAGGRYHDLRGELAVPEAQRAALARTEAHSLHPALAALGTPWAEGELAAVMPVALEGQSRSHFQAMATWWAGGRDVAPGSGWLGRWLDATVDDDPENPLRAVAIGQGAPALAAQRAMATVVNDPGLFRVLAPPAADADAITEALLATASPRGEDPLLAAARWSVPSGFAAADAVARSVDTAGAATTAEGREPGPLGSLLRTAAALIDLDLGTRVVHVGRGGFDTHAAQQGQHDRLLADVADGLTALLSAARDGGWADRLVVATVSEFGRRAQANGSGTDHGLGGLCFVAGPTIAGGQVVGTTDLDRLDEGDLVPDVDARSVYAVCLDHLGGHTARDSQLTDELLGGTYDRLGLLR